MAIVIYVDRSYGEVSDEEVEVLILRKKIIGFKRAGLWVASGIDPEEPAT